MARPVFYSVNVTKGFIIRNNYTDNTRDEHEFFVGDVVEGLKYDDPIDDMVTVNARITDVEFDYSNPVTPGSNDSRLSLATSASVTLVSIDYSEKLHSHLDTIPAFNLLEYQPTKEVKFVSVLPTMKVELKIKLSDGTESSIVYKEGMSIFNLTDFSTGNDITGNYVLRSFLYKVKPMYNTEPIGLFLIGENRTVKLTFDQIKECGTAGTNISKNDNLADVLASTGEDANICLPVTKQEASLQFANNVSIIGPNTMSNPAVIRKVDLDSEAVIAGDITIDAGANVEICGVTFTENFNIINNGAKKLTFKNCSFVGANPTADKSYLIKDGGFDQCGEEGLLLQIENCYFGDNLVTDEGKTYNLFELRAKLADGSYIKNCYFTKKVCTHNVINLYDVMPDATITIENNHFESSVNAVRVGFVGDAHCTVNIINNTYDETDKDPSYAGILLVQPYGTKTTSFEHVIINLVNNVYTKGKCQDYYIYCGIADTQITDETKPVINIK